MVVPLAQVQRKSLVAAAFDEPWGLRSTRLGVKDYDAVTWMVGSRSDTPKNRGLNGPW